MKLSEYVKTLIPPPKTYKLFAGNWITALIFAWYKPDDPYTPILSIHLEEDSKSNYILIELYETGLRLLESDGKITDGLIPYCSTEEELFQQSLVHNFNELDLEFFKVCEDTYFYITACIISEDV